MFGIGPMELLLLTAIVGVTVVLPIVLIVGFISRGRQIRDLKRQLEHSQD